MKAFLAVVETPRGLWESTASVCSGHEAEYRARMTARLKFTVQCLPEFFKKRSDYLADAIWRHAQENGCRMIVREIDIETTPDQ